MASKEEVLTDIRNTLGFVPRWLAAVPDKTIESEWSLIKNWELGDTAIPNKYKELIGLAIATQLQNPYSIALHLELARLAGATNEETEDALQMAKQTAGWANFLQGLQIDQDLFKREVKEMCDAIALKNRAA